MDQRSFFGAICIFCIVNLVADLFGLLSPYLVKIASIDVGPIFMEECLLFGCTQTTNKDATGYIILISFSIIVTMLRVISAWHIKITELIFGAIGWGLRLAIVINVTIQINDSRGMIKGSHAYFFYIATLAIDVIIFGLVAALLYNEKRNADTAHERIIDNV